MDKKTVYDLDTICDSVIFGKPLTEAEDKEKKDEDNDNPFAPSSDSDSDTDDEKNDDAGDTTADDSGDAGSENDSDESDSDESEGVDENPFGDTTNDEGTDDAEGDDENESAAGEVSTEQYSDVADFGIEVLVLSMQAHFWHINAHKSGDHETLNNLYQGLAFRGDHILETVISHTKSSVQAGSELSFDFGDLEFNKDESIGILEDVRAEANDLAARYQDAQDIVDSITDVANVLSEAIYKLSRFDSNEAV